MLKMNVFCCFVLQRATSPPSTRSLHIPEGTVTGIRKISNTHDGDTGRCYKKTDRQIDIYKTTNRHI
jgi:hypothetical protein